MKKANYIFRGKVPYSVDFGDTFYHDGAQIAEREEVYIAPAFALQRVHAKPELVGFCAELTAPELPSLLAPAHNARPATAPGLSSLPGENFNAYLKDAAPSAPLAGQMRDDLPNCRALLAQLGALQAFDTPATTATATTPTPATTATAPSSGAPGEQPPAAATAPISLAILEIGWGFALNFLLAYRRAAREGRRIYYAAVESHYVPPAAIAAHAAALGLVPPTELLAAYPPRAHGAWRIELPHATLDLFFGRAEQILPRLSTRFDAVFFDLFAGQNALYGALLPHCARLCSGRLLSFLANGAFKRALKAAGFLPQFAPAAHKREVCRAAAPAAPAACLGAKTAVVIGAGIAGLLAAKELTRAGVAVLVLDAHGVGSGGSGNILGQIGHACHSPASALGELQYLGACAASRAFAGAPEFVAAGGIERPADAAAAAKIARCAYPLARKIRGGRWLLAGGTISPKFACERLAAGHDLLRERVLRVRADAAGASVECASGARFCADAVVIAAGCGVLGAVDAPLSAVRGQVCWVASQQRRAVSERAYITAARGGVAVLGATFERLAPGQAAPGLREEEASMLLAAAGLGREHLLALKCGWRCYSGDRFALAGSLLPAEEVAAAGAGGAKMSRVFISGAHGSRGLSTAILAARILAEQIAGAPSGVYADLAAECDPNRFLRRKFARCARSGH